LCAGALLAVNLAIAAKLFALEYSAYNGSIEYTFIALPRLMLAHPFQWKWWPFWNEGLPFENSYLPFSHWLTAGLSLATGLSTARAFHIVTAAAYSSGALTLFWMALELSGRVGASFAAALAYSCVSPCAMLLRDIREDAGGALVLRRLQALVYYGEAPHTVALALVPVAVVCFHRALKREGAKWKILAGLATAAVALSNAFGITMLAVALGSLLLAYPGRPWWRAPLVVVAIGIAAWCWISPWLSPAMIRATRAQAATAGGDFRSTAASNIALAAMVVGYAALCLLTRRAAPYLRFFALFAFVPAVLVAFWSLWRIPILPQPHRYQLDADMVVLLPLVFGLAALSDRLSPPARRITVAALAVAAVLQVGNCVGFAAGLIRSVDPTTLSEYKVARWLDANRRGDRSFLPGSSATVYNAFTDNPQVTGGHDQHTVNGFVLVVEYTLYTDMNAAGRDAYYSLIWLKAYGAHSIHVPGPGSTEHFKPYAHPHKFDGVLPVVWHEGDDAIYDVPVRSRSLAHVIPASEVVARPPAHGLDVALAERYVAALEDPRYPLATFDWKNMSAAAIHTTLAPGQVVSVQETYERGWEAWANGRRQTVRGDGLGLIVIEPDCTGPCDITLRYTGGIDAPLTWSLSAAAMLGALVYAWRRRVQTPLDIRVIS
jgi:hypothetical protein